MALRVQVLYPIFVIIDFGVIDLFLHEFRQHTLLESADEDKDIQLSNCDECQLVVPDPRLINK